MQLEDAQRHFEADLARQRASSAAVLMSEGFCHRLRKTIHHLRMSAKIAVTLDQPSGKKQALQARDKLAGLVEQFMIADFS